MRSPRAAAVWVLALLLVFALTPASGAEEGTATSGPDLGAGWSLEGGATGPVLVFTPAEPLPMRDARPEFRDGDALLGYPLERNGRLELALTSATLASLESPAPGCPAGASMGPPRLSPSPGSRRSPTHRPAVS